MTTMWRTRLDIRRLVGAEARLVRAAAAQMCDQLKDRRESISFGTPAFDRLSPEHQAFAVLAVVRRLTDELPPQTPEAWADGAVFALYELVHREVSSEVESSGEAHGAPTQVWRGLVRDALVEARMDDPGGIPALDSTDRRDWDFRVLFLTERVLENHDFFDEGRYDENGTLPDYFAAEPPEWTLAEKRGLFAFLGEIVNGLDRRAA